MKKFLKKINKIFFTFFLLFCTFPRWSEAESLILYEDFKTNTFTEVNPAVFTFHSLSGSPADFNMSDSTSSLVQIDLASKPITSTCNGKSLIGGYQVFGQNFEVLKINFPVPKFNRTYFEWGIQLDIYEFSPTGSQTMDVYSSLSLSTDFKLVKNEIPGTLDLFLCSQNSKISKYKYSSANSLTIATQSLYLLNVINSPIRTFNEHTNRISGVDFSPDGLNVASGSYRLIIYKVLTGVKIHDINAISTIYSVKYSNDGLYLASGHGNGIIRLWDPSTGVLLKTFISISIVDIFHVNFSPDSRYITGDSGDIWDIATETILFSIPSENLIIFSPDGSLFYSLKDWGEKIKVWDFSSGTFLREFKNSFQSYYFVVSSSGSLIAASCTDDFYNEFMYLLETSTGNLLQTYQTPNVWFNKVAFSPNDQYVIGILSSNSIKIWETWTGKLVNELKGHTDFIGGIALSPYDGAYIASGGYDQIMGLWKTSPFSPSTYQLLPGIGYYGLRNLEIYMSFCDQSCEKCAGSDLNCRICVQNAILSERPGKCTCPSGFYWVSSSLNSSINNFICNQCPENCSFCIENQCLSCKRNTFMTIEGKCVNNCPDGWFPEGKFCQKCNDSCSQCTGTTENDCLKCLSNRYLLAQTGRCELCGDNCEVCEGINQCTKCINNYFFNESLFLCQESLCGQNCEVCKDLKLCKKCLDGYFLKKINFCQKKEEISVTLKEISNPTLFSLEFSSYSRFIDRNLEKILGLYLENYLGNNKITYRKIPWPKYFQNITNSSYLIIAIYNSVVPSESLLNFKISFNYSGADTNYFTLSPENLSVKLFGYMPCNILTEYYSNASQSIITKTKIFPQLQYTNNRSIFELKFTNSEMIEIFPSLVKNFSKIIIDELKFSDFTHDIAKTSNTTFSLRIILNKSVVMRPKLEYFIDIPIFYSLNNNFIVDPPQASIDLFDYYLMNQKERESQNGLVKQNVILSYFVESFVFVATIFTGKTTGLECLMISNLIQLTQYNQINYPTNLVEIYETTLPSFPMVISLSVSHC